MEEKATLPSVNQSADTNAQTSSSIIAVEIVSSSTGSSSTYGETNDNTSSTSVLESKSKDSEKHIHLSPEIPIFQSMTTVKSTQLDESCDGSPEITASGFDSADSTNDADFLTTQKAVLSAINLMDEGLENEEENPVSNKTDSITLSSKDGSEITTGTSSTVMPGNNLYQSKTNNEAIIDKEPSSSSGTQVQFKHIFEYSVKVNSVSKKQNTPEIVEQKRNKEDGENNEDETKRPAVNENIVNTLFEKGKTSEINHVASDTSHGKKQLDVEGKCITKVNENSNYSANVHDIIVEKESNIDTSNQNNKGNKGCFHFSSENKSLGKNSDNSNVKDSADYLAGGSCKENTERKCSEDLTESHMSESKACDLDKELVQRPSIDGATKNQNNLNDSDDVIVLDETPCIPDTKVKKSQINPALPVSVEISDVEVSVFKYGREKKDKSKKTEDFKLDDMVLSSDEDSDTSDHIKERSPSMGLSNTSKDILNVTVDVSDIAETIVTPKIDEAANYGLTETKTQKPKELQSSVDKISEIDVMEVDDVGTSQEDCNSTNQEKSSKLVLGENNDNSERSVACSALTNSECLSNENTKQCSSNPEDVEMASSPKSTVCKDNKKKSDDTESESRKDDEIEMVDISENMDVSEKNSENKEADLENALREALAKNKKFREDLYNRTTEDDDQSSSGSTDQKDTEVICLVDDDEDDVYEKKKPAAAINCVNPNCMSGEDLAPPAMFVLSYFGMKRCKGQKVCAECFNMVVEHHEVLSSLLKEKRPMLSANFPSHKDVILLDSDEESLSDNESNMSDDTMAMIRENLDDVITETLGKVDFDFQLRESCNILNNRLSKLEEEAREINKRYDDVQLSLDMFRKQIYEEFQQETREREEIHIMECEIPPMPIIRSKLQNQLYNRELMNRLRKSQQEREERDAEDVSTPTRTIATKKVTQISQPQMSGETSAQDVTFVRAEAKCEPPPNLPPPGPLPRPKLRVGDLAYTMKVSYFSIWVHCRIIEVIPRNATENDPSTETYRVKLESVKKNAVRTVTGKYLAYPTPARVQLKVGVRVISIFKEEDDSGATKDNYYVGVIAEPPKSTNKYRYLVFFDDGYTQYCPHENILVVCATSKNVWEDIHPEPREFIKNYLQQYPERPMVKLSQGQIVKVEWNGRWWIVRVLEVDGSLVKVHFDADRRTEWIYRGSTRLGPMYQELAAAKERQLGSLLRTRGFGSHHKSDMPYVEYTRGDGEGDNDNKPEEKDKAEEPPVEEQTPAPRSVARKSTAKKPQEPVIANTAYPKPLISQLPEGRLRQRKLRPKCRPIKFRPHQCSEACVAWTNYTPAAANKYDPLVKPLMYGFERLLGNYKGKTIVLYRGPCGRVVRTQQEMLCYLRGTRSQMTIDLFDFDFWVNPLNEFEEGSTFGKIEDLSYGKENVRISCVNELDHSMPQYVQYMTARQPAKDVHLNLDPEFLVGCDCTDDCEDRSKCSCWQLTMQGKAYVPDGDLDPLFGYQYRRLPERIATGIYECNSRCKCSMTCQNRVAQQPLSCRLQLFKTLKKGWGIRCLHDIPRGAFICIYAGFLLTEQEANEGGKTYGDEYLAELDYIESVENLKEGYESEAKDPSDFEDDDDISQKDTMDIEYEHSADSDPELEQGYTGRPGDIRLRLRRRTADEAEKESRKSKMDDDSISISDDEIDSGNCGGCRESLENVKDTLRCQGCMKSYHFRCTPLKTSVNVDKLGSNKSSWICPKCDALVRKPKTFDANITVNESEDVDPKYPSVRELYGQDENVYIMDAKTHGNIGRYLNHSCSPNVFVQNVFVDTHDLRFPWVAFFANQYIPAGTELTWDYNYDVGSVPGKVMLCYCGSNHCRGRLL